MGIRQQKQFFGLNGDWILLEMTYCVTRLGSKSHFALQNGIEIAFRADLRALYIYFHVVVLDATRRYYPVFFSWKNN